MAVILDGAFLCSRAVIPKMIAAGGGTIVNVGGVSAHTGAHARAHVSAAKAGVEGLTKALAVEFAHAGIRVNCVAPGRIGGPRSKSSGETLAATTSKPLLPRDGEPEEVAAMIAALCEPSAGFMTGQVIHVNGGMFMS
jgi:3-oxoacyl-[acyl-carrier protein] reductase